MRFRILDFTFALIQDRLSKCIQACVSFPPIPCISKIEYITHLKLTRNLNLTRSRSHIDFYTESLISARQSSNVAVALLKVKLRVWDFEYTEIFPPYKIKCRETKPSWAWTHTLNMVEIPGLSLDSLGTRESNID